MLHKVDWEMLKTGQVQSVEPDHGARSVLPMIMPVPGRSQDDIAAIHGYALSVNCSKATISFDNETQRKGSVPMRGSSFMRHDEL